MRGLQLVPYGTKINFVGFRFIAYCLTALIIAGTFISLATQGLNLGIDFKGGLLLEVRTDQAADFESVRATLNTLELGDVKLQEFGSDRDVLIRVEQQPGGESAQMLALEKIKTALGAGVDYRRVETVGAKVSETLITNGTWAFLFAIVGMLFYIWFRFEWQYGLCGVIALVHDAVAVIGFYSFSGLEFNESAFAAILTTVGYSINDSVVIYDRLRENLRKYKTTPIPELVNLSANETLSRTLLTVGTTLIALVALYWFGGPVIENFTLPIIVGILIGTFSSIFLSVNLLLFFDLRHRKEETEPVASGPVIRN